MAIPLDWTVSIKLTVIKGLVTGICHLCYWNLIKENIYVMRAKLTTVFFCLTCGYTERVQSCSGRQKVNDSSMDGMHMYKL